MPYISPFPLPFPPPFTISLQDCMSHGRMSAEAANHTSACTELHRFMGQCAATLALTAPSSSGGGGAQQQQVGALAGAGDVAATFVHTFHTSTLSTRPHFALCRWPPLRRCSFSRLSPRGRVWRRS